MIWISDRCLSFFSFVLFGSFSFVKSGGLYFCCGCDCLTTIVVGWIPAAGPRTRPKLLMLKLPVQPMQLLVVQAFRGHIPHPRNSR